MQKKVSQLSVRLIFKQLKVSTVESCTGGWIGKTLTDQSGSSEWFAGGLITYTNESKTALANVSPDVLAKYGAVSLETADAMARGAQKFFPGTLSVAVTGVAGPDGGSEAKPVGTVCIATCLNGKTNAKKFHFKGNRDQVRIATVEQALTMVLEDIERQ